MKKILPLLAIICALLSSNISFAQEEKDLLASPQVTNSKGLYFDGNIGYGTYIGLNGVAKKNGFTWFLTAGYKIAENIALEAGFIWLPKIQSIFGGSTTPKALYFATKIIYPFNPQLGLFAKIGLARVTLSRVFGIPITSTNRITPVAGLGAEYTIIPNIGVLAQTLFVIKSGSIPTAVIFTIGVSYKVPI